MDIGDMIGIMTALLFICIICFGLNYDAKDHPVKPKKRNKRQNPWTDEQYEAYLRTGNRSYLCGKDVED